jgi:hypothetical protein
VPDLADALCYPACHACGVAGICGRKDEAIANAKKAARGPSQTWAPNHLVAERLVCGHVQIPWPIDKVLGANISSVSCEECGTNVPYNEHKKVRAKKPKPIDPNEPIPF